MDDGIIMQTDFDEMERQIGVETVAAFQFAEKSPFPIDGDLCKDLFSD